MSPHKTQSDEIPQQRLRELLNNLAAQGVSQREVAARTKVPAQYLSDVKSGRRPLTELFARRLYEEFGVDYLWLLGVRGSMEAPRLGDGPSNSGAHRIWLPVVSDPIEGDPTLHRTWDGTCIELAGAATTKFRLARQPYVLRFGAVDRQSRLRKNDLVLISQAGDPKAEVQVIKLGSKAFLARHDAKNGWERVALQEQRISDEPTIIGHALGIVWGLL